MPRYSSSRATSRLTLPDLCLAVPGCVFVISTAAVALLLSVGWLGEVGEAGLIYCEASRPGFVKQPANTWSNLGYLAAALLVGSIARRDLQAGSRSLQNRMTTTLFYPTLYAGIAAFLAPGSMALHASTTVLGGKIDVFAMYLWAIFALSYAITRLCHLDPRQFVILYVLLATAFALHLITDFPPVSGTLLFGLLLGAYAVAEAYLALRAKSGTYNARWLWAACAMFAIAFAIWGTSKTGGPLCAPDSLWQGHAAWHLLTAASIFALYLYYRSET